MHKNFGGEKRKVRGHLEDLGVHCMIILKRILEKYAGKVWTEFI
jgi:hypothetical protein